MHLYRTRVFDGEEMTVLDNSEKAGRKQVGGKLRAVAALAGAHSLAFLPRRPFHRADSRPGARRVNSVAALTVASASRQPLPASP